MDGLGYPHGLGLPIYRLYIRSASHHRVGWLNPSDISLPYRFP